MMDLEPEYEPYDTAEATMNNATETENILERMLATLLAYMMRADNPSPLNLTAVLAILNELTDEQLQKLYNASGTSSIQELVQHFNRSSMRVKGYEQQFMQFPEFRIAKLLLLYVPPVLILCGTFGNVFSFIILRRKPMRKCSSYMYLACLAIIDTLVLYIGLLRIWVSELTGIDYQSYGNWICKFTVVFGYVGSDLSVWLIIAVTVERYIVVCFPFKASSMCNVSRAKKVIACLFLLMLALNFHFFWTTEIVMINGYYACSGAAPYRQLVDEIWPWVDALIYSFFPFVTIMILNVLIIREVAGARSNRVHLSGSEYENSNSSTNINSTSSAPQHHRRQTTEGSRLTALLLTVSFTFLILTLPNNISLIITRFWNAHVAESNHTLTRKEEYDIHHRLAQFKLGTAITGLLMYANHSINFFLYCATGNKFRQQIFDLFRCLHRGSPTAQLMHSMNTQSVRRTSTSALACRTGDLMMSRRLGRRKSSCVSSDSLDPDEKNEDSNLLEDGKSPNGINGKGVENSLRIDQQVTVHGDKNGVGRNNSEQEYRNGSCPVQDRLYSKTKSSLKDSQRKNRGSSKKRIAFSLNGTGNRSSLKGGKNDVEPSINGHSDGRGHNIISNGLSNKVHFSKKKHRQNSTAPKRGSFGTCDEVNSKDNEYILLQPTIHWRESSTQS